MNYTIFYIQYTNVFTSLKIKKKNIKLNGHISCHGIEIFIIENKFIFKISYFKWCNRVLEDNKVLSMSYLAVMF